MKSIVCCGQTGLRLAAVLPALIAAFAIASTACAADPSAAGSLQQNSGDLLSGIQRAVCYSGFRHGQHPDRGEGAVNPGATEILEDLQLLQHQGFGLIRLYDSSENSRDVLRVIEANKLPMKVLLGAWLAGEVVNTNCAWHCEPYSKETLAANKVKNLAEIESAIKLANQYSNVVVAVVVGNESLVEWNDHLVSVDAVINYVRKVKQAVKQPVTVADNCHWWAERGARLAKEVDFISVHTYPIWEGKDIGAAMAFSIANLEAVRNALPHSRMVITEAGWATAGNEFGARAGEEQQRRYCHDLFDWTAKMNITIFFFEAFDEDWKGDANDAGGAEKHWGLFTTDRKPKQSVQAAMAEK